MEEIRTHTAAELLGIPNEVVRTLISRGELRATREYDHYLINSDDVELLAGEGNQSSPVLDGFAQESMENPLDGIAMEDCGENVAVQCESCGETWFPMLRGQGCFYPGWDRCPSGCNYPGDQEEEPDIKE